MPIGAAVAVYFGATGVTAAVVAGAVNGAIIGAAVSGVAAAATGGNIGKAMLTGAVSGAVVGGVGAYFSASSAVAAGKEAATATEVTATGNAAAGGTADAAGTNMISSGTEGGLAVESSVPPLKTSLTLPAESGGAGGAGAGGGATDIYKAVAETNLQNTYAQMGSGAAQGIATWHGAKETAKANEEIAAQQRADEAQARRDAMIDDVSGLTMPGQRPLVAGNQWINQPPAASLRQPLVATPTAGTPSAKVAAPVARVESARPGLMTKVNPLLLKKPVMA